MKIVACLFDGFNLMGFLVENSKGKVKRVNYSSVMSYVKKGKVDGLTCREIDGKEFIVGLNFQELEIINLKEYDIKIKDMKLYVENGDSLVEIPDKELWDYCLRENLENKVKIGLDLSCGGMKVLEILDGSDV